MELSLSLFESPPPHPPPPFLSHGRPCPFGRFFSITFFASHAVRPFSIGLGESTSPPREPAWSLFSLMGVQRLFYRSFFLVRGLPSPASDTSEKAEISSLIFPPSSSPMTSPKRPSRLSAPSAKQSLVSTKRKRPGNHTLLFPHAYTPMVHPHLL